jgi:hypothetical protein
MNNANPRHDARFLKYKTAFLRHVLPTETRGLEVGAFDLPFILPEDGHVEFLDYSTTEELQERARTAPGHSPDFVVPVTYIAKLGDWAEVPSGYDWIAAAHVIEHAPSMIDWLLTAGSKLKEQGILFLVVPDKRYTFDYFRPETTLGKILEDHFRQKVRPGPAEVFDSRYYSREAPLADLWKGKRPKSIPFDAQAAHGALDIIESATHQYIDVHCNIFSQMSFSLILNALSQEGIVPFYIEELGEVDPLEMDFHCVLRKNGPRTRTT